MSKHRTLKQLLPLQLAVAVPAWVLVKFAITDVSFAWVIGWMSCALYWTILERRELDAK